MLRTNYAMWSSTENRHRSIHLIFFSVETEIHDIQTVSLSEFISNGRLMIDAHAK